MPVDAEKNNLQSCSLGFFFYFCKFGKFEDFFNIFLFLQKKKSLKFTNFQNTGICVLESP